MKPSDGFDHAVASNSNLRWLRAPATNLICDASVGLSIEPGRPARRRAFFGSSIMVRSVSCIDPAENALSVRGDVRYSVHARIVDREINKLAE